MRDLNINLLGENSYPAIVASISSKFTNTDCSTLAGKDLVGKFIKRFDESKMPILELKAFKTNAEAVAGDDVGLKDILAFCDKKQGLGDLNFVINIAKEEHFANMLRNGFPDPKSTIKAIEDEFDQPASVVEEGIKAGLFDSLQSNLLHKTKEIILGGANKTKKLNESGTYSLDGSSVIKYSPIGIKYTNRAENKLVYLVESVAIEFNPEKADYMLADNSKTPDVYKKLVDSINKCAYDPETTAFSPAENWDFDLTLNAINKEIKANGKTLPSSQAKVLLMESINLYSKNPTIVDGFNREKYLAAADNFMMLAENAKQLIQFDTLDVYRDMSESNKFVMVDKAIYAGNIEPKILASSNENIVGFHESTRNVVDSISSTFGFHQNVLTPMFESAINSESEAVAFRNDNINRLRDEQNIINAAIGEVRTLKSLAESGSPAFEKLMGQEQVLSKKLDRNIESLNVLVNKHKPV